MLICIFFVLSQKLVVRSWDDMTEWATVVQGMWQFGKMPQHEFYSGYNYRYPPVYSLYQLFVIYINSAYDEHLLFLAKYILETIFALACFSNIKSKRTGIYYLMAMTVICFLPVLTLGKSDLPYALYADVLFGVLAGYFFVSFSRWASKKGKVELVELALATFMITLVKEAGMIVVAALWASVITIDVVMMICKSQKRKGINDFIPFFISIGTFIVSKLSWSFFLKSRIDDIGDVAVDTQTGVSYVGIVAQIYNFFIGKGESYQYETVKLYLKSLFTRNDFRFIVWEQPWATLFLVGVVIFIIYFRVLNLRIVNNIKAIIRGILTAIYILIGYWMTYAFFLPSNEAVKLKSMDRYLGSFVLGCYLWMFYETLNQLELFEDIKLSISMVIISLIIVVTAGGLDALQYALFSQDVIEYQKDDRLNFRKALNEKDKVYYINAYDNGYDYITYMYLASPIRLNSLFSIDQYGQTIVSYVPRIHKQKDFEREMTYDEFLLDISKYDYVYICVVDSEFRVDYGEAFSDMIENKTLYKVNNDDGVYLTKFKNVKEK
ncbi:hypothetical protein SAMN02910275_02248 [Butyrivibrio sp. INlla18]|nr:hypothetical protein SAMN02910275_02248 [Butyrivibrio sp. INlla18]